VPRLDAERVALWRSFCSTATQLQRQVDQLLIDEHELPLRWFEVLGALRPGPSRVRDLCAHLDEVASSLSRRLDRLEQHGLVLRVPAPTPDDKRAVTVSLTAEGRALWRDANVTYRRAVQQLFAKRLTDTDIAALTRVLGKAGS
jgi:DNA-binding MarR family transcriptional regulator